MPPLWQPSLMHEPMSTFRDKPSKLSHLCICLQCTASNRQYAAAAAICGNDFQEDPTTRGSEPLTRSETTKHRSFLCVEGSLSRTLEFDGAYSYAQKICHKEREREIFWRQLYFKMLLLRLTIKIFWKVSQHKVKRMAAPFVTHSSQCPVFLQETATSP